MYNRYIPQPDGSYQRNRMPERIPNHRESPPCPEITASDPEHCREDGSSPTPPTKQTVPGNGGRGIPDFFRQLLPKNLDTADLLILLLILLMAGDSEESRNNALLTMALYFFL